MPHREYRRLCTKCGLRHSKPTGRKCNFGSTMTSQEYLTPISSRRLSPASSCMPSTMTTTSIVTAFSTPAPTTMTSSQLLTPHHLTGAPQLPASTPGHVFAPQPNSSAAISHSSSITVLSSSTPTAGPMISTSAGSGAGSTGVPAAHSQQQTTPAPDPMVTTLNAMAAMMAQLGDRLTAIEQDRSRHPAPIPAMPPGVPAPQPYLQVPATGHNTCPPPAAAPHPHVVTQAAAMPGPEVGQAPQFRPSQPHHDISAAARVQQELSRLGLDSTTDSDDSNDPSPPQLSRKSHKKLKSGRGRTTQDFVVREVPWPHYGVYKGADRTAASFDGLSIAEFVFGYLGQTQRQNEPTRSLMLGHLRELMQDAMSFPWPNVRNYHGVVLGQMEQAELEWGDRSLIQELRTKYSRTNDTPRQRQQAPRGSPCTDYQSGKCQHTSSHEGLLHACAYCWKTKQKAFRHTEQACKSKQHSEKNG